MSKNKGGELTKILERLASCEKEGTYLIEWLWGVFIIIQGLGTLQLKVRKPRPLEPPVLRPGGGAHCLKTVKALPILEPTFRTASSLGI